MNYFNWKTGHWETYEQCQQSSIDVYSSSLTLEKKSLVKATPKNTHKIAARIKRLVAGYKDFENKLYGRMLGKGHHLFSAALVKWLLRAALAGTLLALLCGLLYAIYALIVFVFKIVFIAVAFVIIAAIITAALGFLAARIVFVF